MSEFRLARDGAFRVPGVIAITCFALIAAMMPSALSETQSAAAPDKGALVEEQWAVMRILGSEVGITHSVVRRVIEEGEPRLHTTATTEISLARAGTTIDVNSDTQSLETEGGELVWLRTATEMSSQETVTEATVVDGKLRLVQSVYGNESERFIEWEPDVLGPYAASRIMIPLLGKPGSEYQYKTFSPDLGAQVLRVKGKVIGPSEKEVFGKVRSLVEVHEESSALPGVVTKTWYESDGTRVFQSTPIAGGIDAITCSEERALAGPADGSAGSVDALVGLAAESNVSLPYPYSTESASYRITLRDGDVAAFAKRLESPRQTVLGVEGNQILLNVRAVPPRDEPSYPLPFEGSAELAEYLASNSWLQSDDAAMRAAAKAAIGDEKDAYAAAKRLERWVYDTIRDKNMSVGFASAKEVLDNPSGDCSEHAVLLAATLRSVGIPARVSMGLLYWNKTFAGHAWTEAYLGEWMPLDATMARPFVSAAHIDLDRSSLSDEGIEDLFLSLAVAIGNVTVEVLEFTQGGRTVRIDEDFRPYELEGDAYLNRVYGVRLERPSGWRFDELDEVGFGSRLLEIEEEGGSGRIDLVTTALPYNSDFFNVLDAIIADKSVVERSTIELDGRKAERVIVEKDGEKEMLCASSNDELMFIFYGRLREDSHLAAFDRILASVRWLE